MNTLEYVGGELTLFAKAKNWKSYFRSRIERHIRGDVLEVGAGMGGTTRVFADLPVRSWSCLEPDRELAAQLKADLRDQPRFQVITGTLADLDPHCKYDAILYIDVLEHIEDDAAELTRAARHLRDKGALIVLSPAHSWLFTPFDRAIGHFRRYTARMYKSLAPPGVRLSRVFYLDSFGLLASLANRVFLRQSMPTERQVLTWDRAIVPISRSVDPLFGFRLGKSVVGIWTKDRE